MTMPRCYVAPERWNDTCVELDADDVRHVRSVLRLRAGAAVRLFDGEGREAEAELVAVDGRALAARVGRVTQHPRPAVDLLLLLAMPKAPRMDWLIEKAVELGVTEICPLASERTVVAVADERADRKAERWRRLALAAARQCGTAWLPRIDSPSGFAAALGRRDWEALFVGSLEPGAPAFRDAAAALRTAAPKRLALLIGPEGDFTPAEYAAARDAGARAVRFGPAVLRVETAALVGLALLAYEFRDR